MNHYFDNKAMFGEPTVNQYDSHMVMSGVVRPTKKQYVNVDTKYRDDVSPFSSLASCNITLPQRICNVKSVTVRTAEIPMAFYNISKALGNNVFYIWHSQNEEDLIVLDDGQYSLATLKTAINAKIGSSALASHFSFDYDSKTNKTTFTTTNRTITIKFNVDDKNDATMLMDKLGWILGFREAEYDISTQSTLVSEGLAQLSLPKYLYLVLDEFSRGNPNSFITNRILRKQILAKIVLNNTTYPFGTILPANNFNGYLLSETREYQGQIDLLRMKVELVDDYGRVVDLNGADFSFTLETVVY